MERPKHVAIVAQGGFGNVTEAEYQATAETYAAMLETARRKDPSTGEETPAATVEIVPTVAALREKVGRTPGAPDVVVFLTLGLVEEMRQIKRLYPNVKIIGFTGAFPRDEIILVPKQWNVGIDGLRIMILDD